MKLEKNIEYRYDTHVSNVLPVTSTVTDDEWNKHLNLLL